MRRMLFLAAAALLAAAPAALAQTPFTKPPHAEKTPPEPIEKIDTATFIKIFASSNEFEIQSSQLAVQSSASDAVKRFARQMIIDHTKAGQDFKTARGRVEITASGAALQPKQQRALDALKTAGGAQFEKAYVAAQVEAHGEAVALFSNYANAGDDPALKEFARKTLPVLEMHLEHVNELQAQG